MVDEQHRFGVHQRLALRERARRADVLVMTATPIPRTLVLTYFGDMDVSVLREKPAGRQPIETRAVPLDRLADVSSASAARVADGARRPTGSARWSRNRETLDVAAAEERFDALRSASATIVGLVHGRMKRGRQGRARWRASPPARPQLLVATTVIEVGVDVPEATIMVIEHAERFGLAQLHQLRGRVGRGAGTSCCLLLYKAPLGATAEARLAIMRETEDGFGSPRRTCGCAAKATSSARGQSGMPGFRIARLEHARQADADRPRRCPRWSSRGSRTSRDARRGAAHPALSVRARRGDPAHRAG